MNMNLGYSLAVEKLCGMKMPEKAQVIRVIIAEMNRIASHLVGMGAYGLDLGTFSPFLYAFREREMILDLFEEVCGARLTYSYITIGGVHDDLPARLGRALPEVPRLPQAAHRRVSHAADDAITSSCKRTANIGIMSKELALTYGCTGPMLRGSLDRTDGDPDWDLRKIEPYCGYESYDFKAIIPPFDDDFYDVPYRRRGGGHRRLLAPLLRPHVGSGREHQDRRAGTAEVRDGPGVAPHRAAQAPAAGRGVRRDRMPARADGLLRRRQPAKDAGAAARAGAVVELLQPERDRRMCRGCLIADIPAIVGSIDIVMGEIDR